MYSDCGRGREALLIAKGGLGLGGRIDLRPRETSDYGVACLRC